MVNVLFFLVAVLSLDLAKTCKPVNYNFKQYGVKHYGNGCKKGCWGWANDTSILPLVSENGEKWETDHVVQDQCVECKTITADFVLANYWWSSYCKFYSGPLPCPYPPSTPIYIYSINDTEMEKVCNGYEDGHIKVDYLNGTFTFNFSVSLDTSKRTCKWNSKKKTCGATSCPHKASIENCNGNWTDGKCVKNKGDTCDADYFMYSVLRPYYPDSSSVDGNFYTDSYCSIRESGYVTCSKVTDYYHEVFDPILGSKCEKYTSDQAKECDYRCTHPATGTVIYYPNTYTKGGRKMCHKEYGCMYAGNMNNTCSYLAIWAFVLILVIVILVVLAIIAAICFVIYKLCCGSKSPKVDPAPPAPLAKNAPQAAASPPGYSPGYAPPPATQGPPPEVGPYVVIKLGKQGSRTKKIESAVWGQSIVLAGLGPEDDDVLFELHDNNDALLGSADVRIPEYVNTKKRAAINLKSGDAVIGVLETDIEVQVQEEPEVKITAVFFVDKFTKA